MTTITTLLQAARAVRAAADPATAARLDASVIRPLARIGATAAGGPVAAGPSLEAVPGAASAIWALAQDATVLRMAPATALPELLEATAALQDLAITEDPSRADVLRGLMAGAPPSIQSGTDGPYLVTNAEDLRDWLGCPLDARPQMALCRCGASARKPFCDGSHATVNFSGAKEDDRLPDRVDASVGVQVTVLDNRATCQHSGFCTERIATAFRAHEEPFVAASGGRMDELIRAVRDCPSGALSYALDGVEARADVDRHHTRTPAIEVTRDGPYRVTGDVALLDGTGAEEPKNAGASHEHYALCRCGHSANKPFCSGAHWYVEDFKDPVFPDPEAEPTMFEWAGGLPALTRMTRFFYEKHVPEDPLLAPLFASMSADHPERVAAWLGEVFGGPPAYSTQYGGYPRMLGEHRNRNLTDEARTRWVQLLLESAREAGLPNDAEFRAAFQAYIEWGSRLAVENSQTGATPPPKMPMPSWGWRTAAGPPSSRISALAPQPETPDPPPVLPEDGETPRWDPHIRSLFRERDRNSMKGAFDLWDHDDVKTHAEAILDRVARGSMPCDMRWPEEQVATFRRWVEAGMAS